MIRVRRYRTFLAFAVSVLVGVFYFGGVGVWTSDSSFASSTFKKWASGRTDQSSEKSAQGPAVLEETLITNNAPSKLISTSLDRQTNESPSVLSTVISLSKPDSTTLSGTGNTISVPPLEDGRGDVEFIATARPVLHWEKRKERYPVKTTIALPKGTPELVPRIQYKFAPETITEQREREKKLDTIKNAFQHSWDGYKQYAWKHDELKPASGGFKDSFCGWGATLVDTLDTLWIMGMKDEFDFAVQATKDIDFTTSDRDQIPLFETTIRYMGGLLGAYDISGTKHNVLVDKAVELAEILMGAFDTPNRMPVTYFNWQPSYASQPRRAGSAAVLAELGSLSMEFTRLAQITNESKYYDAIARITNAFEEWQNQTKLPGMWPLYVDASGCMNPSGTSHSGANGPPIEQPRKENNSHYEVMAMPPNKTAEDDGSDFRKESFSFGTDRHSFMEESSTRESSVTMQEPHLAKDMPSSANNIPLPEKRQLNDDADQCVPKSLSSTYIGAEKFTLGGMADSIYEYLPKNYLLLGGLNDQYKSMYEAMIESVKGHVLYRPMIKENQNLLFTGAFTTTGPNVRGDVEGDLTSDTGHLSCFVGGMVGLGSKIFNRRDELDIARKLTDGCVWAYETSASGIMPEDLVPVICDSMDDCPWNESLWWDLLDPYAATRTAAQQKSDGLRIEVASEAAAFPPYTASPLPSLPTLTGALQDLDKRQLRDFKSLPESQSEGMNSSKTKDIWPPRPEPQINGFKGSGNNGIDTAASSEVQSHEQFALSKIMNDRLVPGLVRIGNRNYILRPEAIESVFYMYRITGDESWRRKGWTMFQAIDHACRTQYGYSAIDDVTVSPVIQMDQMESFWTAETLKYFYLLFSDPETVSLDDYVLNTEAHPFLRPDARR